MITAEEQILAKALAAYNARITDVTATVGEGVGTPQASVTIEDVSGDPADGQRLVFDFENIRANGISSFTIGASGTNEGKITINFLDGTEVVYTGLADLIAYLRSVCWVSTFADANNDGHVVVTVAGS